MMSVGRLRPAVSVHEAQAHMSALAARLEQTYPEFNTWRVKLGQTGRLLVLRIGIGYCATFAPPRPSFSVGGSNPVKCFKSALFSLQIYSMISVCWRKKWPVNVNGFV